MKKLFAGLCLLLSSTLTMGETAPEFKEILATKSHVAAIRQGGYVLYMRHGNTDNTRPDQYPGLDLNDCNTQRLLNDEGRAVVTAVGKSIREGRIPLGDIFVSPMCRAKESARLAFGPGFKVNEQLMYTANLTTQEKKPVLETTRRLLSEPVPPGANRVVLAHAPNMADLIGYFVKPEATVVIIRPKGEGQFEYVASIHPVMWKDLLR